jgi:hypothetical protein
MSPGWLSGTHRVGVSIVNSFCFLAQRGIKLRGTVLIPFANLPGRRIWEKSLWCTIVGNGFMLLH